MSCENTRRPMFVYDGVAAKQYEDYYIRNKKTYLKLTIFSGILLLVFLVLTGVYGMRLNTMRVGTPKKVAVMVAKVERTRFENNVYVIYNDERDEVLNVTDSEIYKYKVSCETGRPIEVYLGNDGKLYANVNGMKNNTDTGKKYFVFLSVTLVLICGTAILYAFVIEAKRREKGIYPKHYRPQAMR